MRTYGDIWDVGEYYRVGDGWLSWQQRVQYYRETTIEETTDRAAVAATKGAAAMATTKEAATNAIEKASIPSLIDKAATAGTEWAA